ncbi:hypothetical protein Vadar_016790 [Vaccinium darrowii]|uniref:Uncharacterized protein n=1 Tax=Vaccinium darrowii TaxID=229202 RepID=A0ACB7XR70_9ERIC|nr:hypothetical protein Vadar_016790 [Vaccinium darrowii]
MHEVGNPDPINNKDKNSITDLSTKSLFNPAYMEIYGFYLQMGLSYGCPIEDHKRWSEGDLQVILSRYSPAWYGLGKISPGLQMGYCTYCLWAPNSMATVFYYMIPSLYLLRGISLFPQVPNPWFLPFAYELPSTLKA